MLAFNRIFSLAAILALLTGGAFAQTDSKQLYTGKPIKALLITGGCCHNYTFQSKALTMYSGYPLVSWKIEG